MTKSVSKFIKLNICILTISSSRTLADDKSGNVLEKKISEFGHTIYDRKIVKDNKSEIQKIVINWGNDSNIDVIITTGGTGLTGSDVTPEALEEIFEKTIDGFSIIFHQISYKKIKTLLFNLEQLQEYIIVNFFSPYLVLLMLLQMVGMKS